MASEPKDYTIFIWMILTSNTEATDKVQFLNLAYRVKGRMCHSKTLSACLNWRKKQQQQNNTRYLKVFFVIFFS